MCRLVLIGRTLEFEQEDASPRRRVCWSVRQPDVGPTRPGLVRHAALVQWYLQALDHAYDLLVGPPHARSAPRDTVTVILCDGRILGERHTSFFWQEQEPEEMYVVLPSDRVEALEPAACRGAQAAAVHELAHAFNAVHRPSWLPSSANWNWFDEATAVYTEALVLGESHEWLRYAWHWTEYPNEPMGHRRGYSDALFVRYLASRFGPEFIGRVWSNAKPEEAPLETIHRLALTQQAPPLQDLRVGADDLFAEYCRHAWFTADPSSLVHAPEVSRRWGHRALAGSAGLGPGHELTNDEGLDHLACQYYRYRLREVHHLSIALELTGSRPELLKASIVLSPSEERAGRTVVLPAHSRPDDGGVPCLADEVSLTPEEASGWLLVVVAHTGWGGALGSPNTPHEDGQTYVLRLSARTL